MNTNEKEKFSAAHVVALLIYLIAFISISTISRGITTNQTATIGQQMGEISQTLPQGNVSNTMSKITSLTDYLRNNSLVTGTLSQVGMILSTFITLAVYKKGFLLALVCNCVSIIMVLTVAISQNAFQSLPGAASSVTAIILITIIHVFSVKVIEKNKEISRNYAQLIESNRVIKEKDEKLSYLAYYDILTRLPNRHMFIEKINETILNSSNTPFTVLLADIDNFKQINDAHGNQAGDVVLVTYAEKLKQFCEDNIFLGKIGGDEYAFIIQGNMTEANILNYVEKIQNIISEPIQINNATVSSTVSIGIASYPNHAVNSSDILKCLDSAVSFAKANGKNRPCFYEQHS